MLSTLLQILTEALLPVLAIVSLGFLLQRYRPMQTNTLVTLNLYLFVPVYLFLRVFQSTLSWWNIVGLGIAVLLPLVLMGAVIYALLRRSTLPRDTVAAVLVGALFANAGNFGLPVAELAFGGRGGQVHAIVVLFANFSVFSLAFAILAMGRGQGYGAMLNYFKLPYFYTVVAALLIRDLSIPLPAWLVSTCQVVAAGLVPIALVTLGAQLARRARPPHVSVVVPVMVVKLLMLPVITLVAVRWLGLWPWPGIVVVLASAAPTAVNPLLLAMQLDGDADTLSDCVFWTTVFSSISVSIWLTLFRTWEPELLLGN